MLEAYKKQTELAMKKVYDVCLEGLTRIRTGRAHTGILEAIKVEYYGNSTFLKNVANIVASDARTLTVIPWDKNMTKVIEKAIRTSDLGLNPVVVTDSLRVPIPPLTEERRKEFVKVVKSSIEGAKVSIRNVRREVLDQVKTAVKNKEISEDILRRIEGEIQKITDRFILELEKIGLSKEQELMKV